MRMKFPVGLNDHDCVSVTQAIELLNKYSHFLRIEESSMLFVWNALHPDERRWIHEKCKNEHDHDFDVFILQHGIEHYGSLEEYLLKGYREWRGGEGYYIIVSEPIEELPFNILIKRERGRDSDGDWSRLTYKDKHGKILTAYSHAAYYSRAGNGTYIYPDPLPRMAIDDK